MIKFIFKCETAPDFNIRQEISEEDWNLIVCKCKKAGISNKITHIVDNDMKRETEEIWIVEPYATSQYGKMISALILA